MPSGTFQSQPTGLGPTTKSVLFRVVEQRSGPIAEQETVFDFLERGASPEAVAIRRWMEAWFRDFPSEHRDLLKPRLRSKDLRDFVSAYFELQVFAMLRWLDCDVAVHPCFPDTGGTVDFSAADGREEFYVEATVCGVGQGVLRLNANEEDAVRKITDAFPEPHSDIKLRVEGRLERTLSKHRLITPIRKLLESCSPREVQRLRASLAPPQAAIEEGDWLLEASLLPASGREGKGAIRGPTGGGSVDGVTPLAKALSRKAEHWKRKGLDDESFLIAVSVCHADFFLGDREEAIYRRTGVGLDRNAFRESLSGVTGVLVFSHATLGMERSAPVRLFLNPSRRPPKYLDFLRRERRLAELIGMA